MKSKKLIALGLAAVMTASALTACGNTEEEKASASSASASSSKVEEQSSEQAAASSEVEETEEKGITFPLDETMNFTAVTILNGGQFVLSETAAWQKLEELGNISVEFTDFQNSEVKEKGNLLIAGGDYPDFFIKCMGGYANEYGMEGIFIPLEDLIREYMPNLTAILDERDGWSAITATDGHIYALPRIDQTTLHNGNAPLWINKKWMDDLGLKEPESLDDLYEILKAFKENDCNGNGDPNDEIPITFTVDTSWFPPSRLIAYMGDGLHNYTNYTAYIDGELVYYPLTDAFKDNFLGFLDKLGDEGLIDPNAFTQTQEQLSVEGMAANIYGCFFRTDVESQVPEENIQDYITVKPFAEGTLPLSTGITKGGMVITDKCENPEVLCAWIDYLYSEEGALLATMGIEGVSYQTNDKGEWSEIQDVNRWAHIIYGTAAGPFMISDINDKVDSELDPDGAYQANQRAELNAMGTVIPTLIYTEEESKIVADLQTDIHGYISTYTAQVATGQVDLEKTWEEFQKTLKNMRVDELANVYQAAYERSLAE